MSMLTFIFMAVVLPILCALVYTAVTHRKSRFYNAAEIFWPMLFLFALFLTLPTVGMAYLYNGLMPDYSTGVREGYITKMSHKGIIFKTWECEMQVGSGQQAALQAPWAFSIPDSMTGQVQPGKQAKVSYQEWLILPARHGKTDYLATDIDPGWTTADSQRWYRVSSEISPPEAPPAGNVESRR